MTVTVILTLDSLLSPWLVNLTVSVGLLDHGGRLTTPGASGCSNSKRSAAVAAVDGLAARVLLVGRPRLRRKALVVDQLDLGLDDGGEELHARLLHPPALRHVRGDEDARPVLAEANGGGGELDIELPLRTPEGRRLDLLQRFAKGPAWPNAFSWT